MTSIFETPIPPLLLVYETLLHRKELASKDRQQYEQLLKGFMGERKLQKTISSFDSEMIIPMFDLLFEANDTEFQIDCLLLTLDAIYLLEVKNFSGDYYLDNGRIFSLLTKKQITNPLYQLERTSLLFNQLLEQLNVNLKVIPYIVFINDQFMLYGASPKLPMIFPSQIERFIQRIVSNTSFPSERIHRLKHSLENKRKRKSDFERLPNYQMSELKRGVFCLHCGVELERVSQQSFYCRICNISYSTGDVILIAVAQYHLLFPRHNITTKNITDWCGDNISKGLTRKVLSKKLNTHKKGRYTYYTFKNKTDHLELLYTNKFI